MLRSFPRGCTTCPGVAILFAWARTIPGTTSTSLFTRSGDGRPALGLVLFFLHLKVFL